MKDKRVEDKVQRLIAKAKATETPKKVNVSAVRRRSSLHQIIRTEQQASSLMAALKLL